MPGLSKTVISTLASSLVILSTAAHAAMPTATCRSTDKPEGALSGFTTQAEVTSGANLVGFNCNVDLVGKVQGEGASWQTTSWKTCAYYDQANNPTGLVSPGTVVVDVSDPKNPVITDHLTSPSMLDPWESLKVNPARQLLAGDQQPSTGFAIYDISGDCRHPVLKSSINIPGSAGHAGQWAPDGKTYYITTIIAVPSLVAVDTTDVTNPKPILQWSPPAASGINGDPIYHDLEFSKDGNTAYQAVIGGFGAYAANLNGLVILDVSDIQQRRPNPTIRILGSVSWDDGSIVAQNALPVTIAGKPYILFTDELGAGGFGAAAGAAACAAGKSNAGFPRLIDVSDPTHPTVVSKLQMGVADPANCTTVQNGIPITGTNGTFAGAPLFGYSCHYCNVDDADNAKIAACSCFSAGLRIFDISDPLNPKEKGYYKPPAQGTKVLPGSQYYLLGGAGFSHPTDWSPSKASFPKDRGETSGDIWTTFQDNGFAVLHVYEPASSSGCSTTEGSPIVVGLLGLLGLAFYRRRSARR
jgi:MYXO-CTERM domain-containing protein